MRSLLPLPPDQRGGKSADICRRIADSAEWWQAKTVALFAPQPREPDIEGLWAHAAGKTIAYPRVEDDRLALYSVPTLYDLHPARWGIREPAPDPARLVAPETVDLILVPGVAFTQAGARCGRGGGFYDRLLATLPIRTRSIGICFALQIVPELPAEPHDIPMDAVITERD